jgi:hydrogenase expression/formation protein HypE
MAASAAAAIPGISVVEAALLAVDLGATALHDPTEGGLAAGLADIADASGVRLEVEEEAVLWFEPGRAVCRALGADPWGTLASGTLLAVFEADACDEAVAVLCAQGHRARAIGRAVEGRGVFGLGGRPIPRTERDEVARLLAAVAGLR